VRSEIKRSREDSTAALWRRVCLEKDQFSEHVMNTIVWLDYEVGGGRAKNQARKGKLYQIRSAL
jgi:hypothetical protein